MKAKVSHRLSGTCISTGLTPNMTQTYASASMQSLPRMDRFLDWLSIRNVRSLKAKNPQQFSDDGEGQGGYQ